MLSKYLRKYLRFLRTATMMIMTMISRSKTPPTTPAMRPILIAGPDDVDSTVQCMCTPLTCTVHSRPIYVTVNVSNQGMCIFPEICREFTHSLKNRAHF